MNHYNYCGLESNFGEIAGFNFLLVIFEELGKRSSDNDISGDH